MATFGTFQIRQEWITVASMGPFKQNEDLGIPLRKGALSLLSSVTSTAPLGSLLPVARCLKMVLNDSEELQPYVQQLLKAIGDNITRFSFHDFDCL